MPIAPVLETAASEKVAQTYERLREVLGVDALPESILRFGAVESFLRDFYMNFKKFVATEGALDVKTKSVLALAAAYHAQNCEWIGILRTRALEAGFGEQELADVAAIVATNAMYNTFFKFREMSGSELFSGMGVGLRAHTFTGTSFDERTVELINIVISDLNACRPCTSGHVAAARELGLSDEQLLEAVQCAATVAAACQFTSVASP